MYEIRRQKAIESIRGKIEVARAKVDYISMILDGRLTLFGAKSSHIVAALEARDFVKVDGSFQYLLKMPLDSLCSENIIRLQQALEALERELDYLEHITSSQLWLDDLNAISKIK
jgi:DNA topoisomerase-2